ncbi:Succinate dehydrogenase/fumarate reductase, flavoprotein subunit [Paracoccus alcaliphilus]|uniref:Succinate dehydrogenase/fumarate reductase, flavoprotein subunit n=1 Tax=Paracoccus alcaliphilus TaxID=34002 RepID=A0A1H8F4D6_9RHOB|nr:FAD-dependent oxidoreductase [Paracoccus alcaliphilus]WCR20372.1 FAD-dependent oxidoreductase [Paracoccus alcaliphilus]SEN26542.1 Succinate dehydrogenase/fumarate reductase, flavoprotein subunit [Paracoccus alcaliphilus]
MSQANKTIVPEDVDLLVIGAGAGGMTTALIAALEGLRVVLCEKTGQAGGTTSTSGGTTWVPGNSLGAEIGAPDDARDAAAFLRHVTGDRDGEDLRQAFLASGRAAIDDLQNRSEVKFAASAAHPDYLDGPGSAWGGRALGPLPFDGRLLGDDFPRVRPPRREFMGLGGMMVGRAEIDALLNPFGSVANFRNGTGIVLRYLKDRLRHPRGTRLLMGNALVARLLFSLRRLNVPVLFDTSLDQLLVEDGRVTGTSLRDPQGGRVIRARRGVVLATGGIGWNDAIRTRLFPEATRGLSLSPETNTGDGADAAMRIGARLTDGGDSPALWMPCSTFRRADGQLAVWPHILLDRAKPGLLAVDASGQRFVNESDSYHDFCMGQIRKGRPAIPAWLICDAAFIRRYGLGMVLPGGRGLRAMLKAGYLLTAPDLTTLAERIGVGAEALTRTVARYNQFATSGEDSDFGRGTSAMNRFNGDAQAGGANPCLGPVGPGPFYALAVTPADLASSAGLAGDIHGRVLDQAGAPIAGLYAVGNDLASIFGGTYPGPGTTIGPALVFGWRVARHAAGLPTPDRLD